MNQLVIPFEPVEQWRIVEGWPYEVSSQGRVRRTVLYNNSNPDGSVKCSISKSTGYPSVCMSRGNFKKSFFVHQLVAEAFLGPRPSSRHVVAHADGTRDNNRLENLRWATYEENEADKLVHGTRARGEKIFGCRLTERDVVAIRASNETIDELAPIFGVDRSTIWKVRCNRIWKHVA